MDAETYLNGLPDTFQGMLDRVVHSPRDARVKEWLTCALARWREQTQPPTDVAWRARELLALFDLIAMCELKTEFVRTFMELGLINDKDLKERVERLKLIGMPVV